MRHENQQSARSSSMRRGTTHKREPDWHGSASQPLECACGSDGMKRGIGYCLNTDCENADGVLLLSPGDTFFCQSCGRSGKVEKERGFQTGSTGIFREVRVEFDFEPIEARYREVAIVRDESLPSRHDTYTLQSPFLKSEKQALELAETFFVNLTRAARVEIPRTAEVLLSFDDDFAALQQRLRQVWEAGERCLRPRLAHARDDSLAADRVGPGDLRRPAASGSWPTKSTARAFPRPVGMPRRATKIRD